MCCTPGAAGIPTPSAAKIFRINQGVACSCSAISAIGRESMAMGQAGTRLKTDDGTGVAKTADNGTTNSGTDCIPARCQYINSSRFPHTVLGGPGNAATGEAAIATGYLTTASGDTAFTSGYMTIADGPRSTAMGHQTSALGAYSVAAGYQCSSSGSYSIAMGRASNASGSQSVALGSYAAATTWHAVAIGQSVRATGYSSVALGTRTSASGGYSMAVGYGTNATGGWSTALGNRTVAAGNASVSMGAGITAHEDESLAVSGDVYARNFLFHADERLMHEVSAPGAPSKQGLLDDVGALRVVEYAESAGDSNIAATSSARTLGLLAQHETHVRSGVSVGGAAGRVKSLDLRVVVSQLVGAVQELTAQNKAWVADMKAQAAAIKAREVQNKVLAGTVAAQAAQIAELTRWKFSVQQGDGRVLKSDDTDAMRGADAARAVAAMHASGTPYPGYVMYAGQDIGQASDPDSSIGCFQPFGTARRGQAASVRSAARLCDSSDACQGFSGAASEFAVRLKHWIANESVISYVSYKKCSPVARGSMLPPSPQPPRCAPHRYWNCSGTSLEFTASQTQALPPFLVVKQCDQDPTCVAFSVNVQGTSGTLYTGTPNTGGFSFLKVNRSSTHSGAPVSSKPPPPPPPPGAPSGFEPFKGVDMTAGATSHHVVYRVCSAAFDPSMATTDSLKDICSSNATLCNTFAKDDGGGTDGNTMWSVWGYVRNASVTSYVRRAACAPEGGGCDADPGVRSYLKCAGLDTVAPLVHMDTFDLPIAIVAQACVAKACHVIVAGTKSDGSPVASTFRFASGNCSSFIQTLPHAAPPPPPPPPGPPPRPPPPPGPVHCDPKARPVELCPGGVPCPPCGKVWCVCPKGDGADAGSEWERAVEDGLTQDHTDQTSSHAETLLKSDDASVAMAARRKASAAGTCSTLQCVYTYATGTGSSALGFRTNASEDFIKRRPFSTTRATVDGLSSDVGGGAAESGVWAAG